MSRLSFALYDHILIRNNRYQVIGSIEFKNDSDQKTWKEYKLKAANDGKIYWLSIDLCYNEYALYDVKKYSSDKYSEDAIKKRRYKQVDKFNAKVIACDGEVDVVKGDRVTGTEYEDRSEEFIIAVEEWCDEVEYSEGYYIESYQIRIDGEESVSSSLKRNILENEEVLGGVIQAGVIALVLLIAGLSVLFDSISSKTAIYKHLKKNDNYKYSTSITSTGAKKEKAHVYESKLSLDDTVTDIIDGIEGNTEDVSTNTMSESINAGNLFNNVDNTSIDTEDGSTDIEEEDDNSVAILTKYEYCLVYESEDGEVLVQVSSRLYTYTSDATPYRSRVRTRNFYKGYYYKNVYTDDADNYSSYKSYYSDADTSDFDTTSSSINTYSTYANSVRQESASSRSSLGGGSSFGK